MEEEKALRELQRVAGEVVLPANWCCASLTPYEQLGPQVMPELRLGEVEVSAVQV